MNPRSLLLAFFVACAGIASAATADAEKRLHTAVDEVLAIADKATSNASLMTSLRPVLEQYLSFEAMTRRAVGPGWRQFSPQQHSEAVQLFTTLIIRTYSSKFTPGEHPVVQFKAGSETAPGRVEIPTTLLYQGSRYNVTYRLEQSESWRITDVVIEGVSLIANYRTQFDEQFKNGGPSAVVGALKQSVNNPK